MIDNLAGREIMDPADRLPSSGTGIDQPNVAGDRAATGQANHPAGPKRRFGPPDGSATPTGPGHHKQSQV